MPLTYEIGIMNPRPLKKRSKKRVRKSRASGGSVVKLKRNSKGRFMKRGASSPKRRRRRRHVAAAAAPRRRRRRRAVARATNPRRRYRRRHHVARRRRRSNPRGFSLKRLTGGGRESIVGQVTAGAVGAGGALGLDVLLGYATFIPDNLKTGMPRNLLRVGGAVALGWGAGKLFGHSTGRAVTLGAMTVVLYSIFKDMLVKAMPTLPGLGDYEEMEVGYLDAASVVDNGTGAYLENGTGAYMESGMEMEQGAGAYMEF